METTNTQGHHYRPLDRSRNEIRFLRIQPPVHPPCSADPLAMSNDPVHCTLEYHDLTNFIHDEDQDDTPSPTESDKAQGSVYLHRSVSVGERHMGALREGFQERKDYLKTLVPREDWDEQNEVQLQALWEETWLCADLSSLPGSKKTPAYIALSYVWAKEPRVTDEERKLRDLRRILRDTSPACAELFDKVVPPNDDPESSQSFEMPEIFLDGHPFPAGQNLESALRALRELPEVRSGLLIWVDALCINQDDIEERNIEVKRMFSIYKNSARVAMWLSEIEERHIRSLEIMNFIGEARSLLKHQSKDTTAAWSQHFDLLDMFKRQAEISDLPYWYRTWIVQEVAVAPHGSFIICGNRRFLWENILLFDNWFTHRLDSLGGMRTFVDAAESSLRLDVGKFTNHMKNLCDASRWITKAHSTLESIDWTFDICFTELASKTSCTDSRDRIYGLMNLLPKDLVNLIQPDYGPSATLAMVMASFAIAHIKVTGRLRMLLLAADISPMMDPWPSWVPNLTKPYQKISLTLRNAVDLYNAGSSLRGTVSWGPARAFGVPMISCEGISLGSICEVGARVINRPIFEHCRSKREIHGLPLSDQDIFTDVIRVMLKGEGNWSVDSRAFKLKEVLLARMEQVHGPTPSAIPKLNMHKYGGEAGLRQALEACFKVLGWTTNPSRSDITSIFDLPLTPHATTNTEVGNYYGFSKFCREYEHLDFWGKNLESFFNHQDRKPYFDEAGQPMLSPKSAYRMDGLFTTTSGYVGATQDRIRPGDEIYILFGLAMPVVLRKVGGKYRMVEKVYIHGVMNGEAIDKWEAEGGQSEVVTIA